MAKGTLSRSVDVATAFCRRVSNAETRTEITRWTSYRLSMRKASVVQNYELHEFVADAKTVPSRYHTTIFRPTRDTGSCGKRAATG